MCGRISLFAPSDLVAERFDAEPVRPLEPRYNVAPGQAHPVVRNDDPDAIRFPTWGLVPQWASESNGAGAGANAGHINARAETLAEKPSFREAFAERRCLVLADGFYDWKETPTGKQPYRIEREGRKPMALAGLWEPAGSEGREDPENGRRAGATFTVVTTEPNEVVEPIHHRMPVVLDPDEEARWLRGGRREGDVTDLRTDPEELADLLDPYPASEMCAYPISSKLGDPENDSPDVIEEVPAEEDVQTGLDEF